MTNANLTGLPRWVWDLVISLQKDEAEHGNLFTQNGDGWVRSEWCPGRSLDRVPETVRTTAAVLAGLLRPTEPEGNPVAPAQAALDLLGGPVALPWSHSNRVDDDEHETVTVEPLIRDALLTVGVGGYDRGGNEIPAHAASTTVNPIEAARALLTVAAQAPEVQA